MHILIRRVPAPEIIVLARRKKRGDAPLPVSNATGAVLPFRRKGSTPAEIREVYEAEKRRGRRRAV